MIVTLPSIFILILLVCRAVRAGEDSVSCYRPPMLAPFQDCKDVLIAMDRAFGVERDPDRNRVWGRSVNESDRNHVKLPIGFKLVRHFGKMETKRCEIHVDNDIGSESKNSSFPAGDVTWAGYNILNYCYPYGLTGKVWMAGYRIIYVTTIYTSWPYEETRLLNKQVIELDPPPSNATLDAVEQISSPTLETPYVEGNTSHPQPL